ncbi:unnamed protein product [Camellia sinensis]
MSSLLKLSCRTAGLAMSLSLGGRPAAMRRCELQLNLFTGMGIASRTLKILSYNVSFREDLEMDKRMEAIGDLIQLHSPDLICFQEVTSRSYCIFQQSRWWKLYRCSVTEKPTYRQYFCLQLILCVAEVEVQADMPLVVASSHLESPCPKWDKMFSKERVDQAKEALNFLKKDVNVIFCGDMNWDEELDGQFPLPEGWVDAWVRYRPGENGWTFDTKSNQMLSGNWPLQKRLDRFVCNLRDFKIRRIDMVGMEAIPGLSYCKKKLIDMEALPGLSYCKKKGKNKKLMVPVLPSDHYGLLSSNVS